MPFPIFFAFPLAHTEIASTGHLSQASFLPAQRQVHRVRWKVCLACILVVLKALQHLFASEQGGAQPQPCLDADTVPAAVAIGKKQRQNCPSFEFLKNLFKSAGLEPGCKFLSGSDARWVHLCHPPLRSVAAG